MKYEAKNVDEVAVSQPGGLPWIQISHANAIPTAAAACEGCRIPSDAEWLAIAADVLSIKYNWSGGEVGKGYIYSGHNDNDPGVMIEAGSDDSDGYFNTNDSNVAGANQRRTLYLSSGDVIWDLAGNAWEFTQGSIAGTLPGLPGNSIPDWIEWTDPDLNWGSFGASGRPSALASIPSLNPISTWDSSKGIGSIFSGSIEAPERIFRRGGMKDGGSGSGVLALSFNSTPINTGTTFGFRAVK